MLKLHNTLTRTTEDFESLVPGKVNFYACGPTVYDYIHLGNARTFTAFDMVVRYLRFSGYDVNYVRNITDIDDKIIKRANENNEDFSAVTQRFVQAFREDMQALGLLAPTHEPRATEYVPRIIEFIEKLIAADKAYIAGNGDVYYAVRNFAEYGCLSNRNIDELESGARVEVNDVKRDPLDFVLWKMAKPNEPAWDSPWGAGRPGWHIECSAMAIDLLGETFDIHAGGRDLIFPHHENEIAQSQGVTHKLFARYWLHAGYLQLESEKMSKSLGNFFTLRDLLTEHPAEVIRFFLLSSHYRSPLSYLPDSLSQAKSALSRLYTVLRDLPVTVHMLDKIKEKLVQPHTTATYPFYQKFMDAMDDDFNTPVAFSVLFELAHTAQRLRAIDEMAAYHHVALLKYLGNVLGLLQEDPVQFMQTGVTDGDGEKINALIAAREAARANKNWVEADRIRDELQSLSVVLEDGAGGTQWRRG